MANDVPLDAQGNKVDPTGRGIDDLLRSIIPGALPQSTEQQPAFVPPVMGRQNIQTGIQDVAPAADGDVSAIMDLLGDVPVTGGTGTVSGGTDASDAVPNVPSGGLIPEDDSTRQQTGEQVPFDPNMTKSLLEVIREALASQPAQPLQPTQGVNPLSFVGGS